MSVSNENRIRQQQFLNLRQSGEPVRKSQSRNNFVVDKPSVYEKKSDSTSAVAKKTEKLPANNEELYKQTIEELKTVIQAINLGVNDAWELTDLIFYARHPEMKGVEMTGEHQQLLDEWNSISGYIIHPTLNEIKNNTSFDQPFIEEKSYEKKPDKYQSNTEKPISLGNYTTKFDSIIHNAVEWCPGLSPAVLKSLLAQESNFNSKVINKYGYAGIAQFGRTAASEVGLKVGIAGTDGDERLNPTKAIPGAAKLLTIKARRLGEIAFSNYGQPSGDDFWKFILAAYNGGEGTVTVAMGHAYRKGLNYAREKGLNASESIAFARKYASNWENLKVGGTSSPLGLAAARFFPKIAVQKYHEIGNYPTQIFSRL